MIASTMGQLFLALPPEAVFFTGVVFGAAVFVVCNALFFFATSSSDRVRSGRNPRAPHRDAGVAPSFDGSRDDPGGEGGVPSPVASDQPPPSPFGPLCSPGFCICEDTCEAMLMALPSARSSVPSGHGDAPRLTRADHVAAIHDDWVQEFGVRPSPSTADPSLFEAPFWCGLIGAALVAWYAVYWALAVAGVQ